MSKLNQEEQALLDSVENGEWQTIDNVDAEIKRYQTYANYHINQKKIAVSLSTEDSQKIQKLANELGKSIPDLTTEILHKYLQGELIEKVN